MQKASRFVNERNGLVQLLGSVNKKEEKVEAHAH